MNTATGICHVYYVLVSLKQPKHCMDTQKLLNIAQLKHDVRAYVSTCTVSTL